MLLLFVCCLVFISWIHILLGYSDKTINKMFNVQILKLYLQLMICIMIMTSFIEELIFRYIFWKLEEKYNYNFAIISSLLFSAYHINNFQNSDILESLLKYVFQFVVGLYLYELKSLTLVIFIHIMLNLTVFVLSFYRYSIL